MALCHYLLHDTPGYKVWGWLHEGTVFPLDAGESVQCMTSPHPNGLLALEKKDAQAILHREGLVWSYTDLESSGRLLPPVDFDQEVWAAGVTYESSKFARMAESTDGGDFYAKVYAADRPELFFKASFSRCVGQGGDVRIRKDSTWNVPEPELAVLVAATGQILGYTVGNDLSSRDIEGANPLYLPQAKVYRQCCGLGPVVVPAQNVDARNLPIKLTISRGKEIAFRGETNTGRMRRTVEELVAWLFRENDFPHGVVLLTGTGVIPPDDFTLQPGDEVAIEIEGVGTLRNRVVQGS
jgi:2-dehydro-3-deoxy-D-arabinonate dehydratase